MHKRLVLVAMLFCLPCLTQAQRLEQNLSTLENAVWHTAIGAHPNLAAFQKYLGPRYFQVDGAGVVSNTEESLKAFRACQLDSVQIDETLVRELSPTVATIAYRVHATGTCGQQPIPPFIENVDTWVKTRGQWLVAAHTEAVIVERH